MKLAHYTLQRLVAQGGMAELWLARQEGPGGFARRVAIKRVLPHLATDERFVEMFLDEARLAALLTHPNIVQVFDFGENEGEYFLSMEFIDGRSLDEVLTELGPYGGRLAPELAAHLVAEACVGLDYAHKFKDPDTGERLHLVHRDVSPQNLMVSFDGHLKVMDFGIAKATTSKVKTETGTVKGKYAYMSPEQVAGGQALDARSDVFALGIILFEAVSGVRPFGDESDLTAVTAILNDPPKPIREFVPDLDGDLEAVLHRALAKDREERYPDAKAMHGDLQAFLRSRGRPVDADTVAEFMGAMFEIEAPAPLPVQGSAPEDPLAETAEAIDTAVGPPGSSLGQGSADPASHTRPAAEGRTVIGAPVVGAGEAPTPIEAPPAPADSSDASPQSSAEPNGRLPVGKIVTLALAGLALVGGGAWWESRDVPEPTPATVTDATDRAAIETTLIASLTDGRAVLRIEAPVGTAIFLDGRSLGPAPVDPQLVRQGSHTVRALPPGGTPWEGSITVLSMQRAVLRIP